VSEHDGDAKQASWREAATILGLTGLLVTMVFNTVGVCQQVDQADRARQEATQTRIDTQIGLVTQLNALSAEAERDVVAAGVDLDRCRIDWKPTPQQRAAVARAARYYDYLAWLFNQRQVALSSAREYAAKGMLDMYELAVVAFTLPGTKTTYPELRRFKLELSATRLRDPCAGVP
jgi:hypothetical protein